MSSRARKWLIGSGIGVVALIGLVYGAIFIYANFIKDSPDPLDRDDLTAAVTRSTTDDATTDATTIPPTTGVTDGTDETQPGNPGADPDDATVATTAPATEAGGTGDDTPESVSGTWTVTPDSEFGYRVDEVLAGVNTTAVGRSSEIEGTMTIDGTVVTDASFVVDVASIESDDGRRDNQFRGRVMQTDQFPTASFELTEPIDFGVVPTPGEQIETVATGELTMHGVTNTVMFDVTAELGDNGIGVLGAIPIEFEDYDIDNPSFGAVNTEDHGLLEFVLVFRHD